MNIIKEVIVGTIEFAKDFVLHVAKAIHRTTGFEDNVIIVGTSVTIMVAPIVYFLLETFTQNFDWKKLTAIIVTASTFFGSVLGKDNLTFTETLIKHATVSYISGINFSRPILQRIVWEVQRRRLKP